MFTRNTVVATSLVATGLLALLGGASARDHVNGVLTPTDRAFVRAVAESNTAEIRTSQMALTHTNNPAVLKFARHMIHDHTIAQGQLARIASNNGGRATMHLSPQDAAAGRKLMRLHGAAFDRAYMSVQLQGHTKAVGLFQNEIAHGRNSDVTNFATANVKTIQDHLQMASDITGTQNRPSRVKNPRTLHG